MKPQSKGIGAPPSDGKAPVDTHPRELRAPSTWFDSSRELATGLDAFELSTAWTFSRTGGGMIDEYIVDYEEYVGIGSGAFSYLRGDIYLTTFSLRDYSAAIAEGSMPLAVGSSKNTHANRMRYRFLMELFGLRLDKRKFERDFGVSVERGLPAEMLFFRTFGGFATDNAEELTLTEKGRYLTVVMQRTMFTHLNSLRDSARNALAPDERQLLFGDGTGAGCVMEHANRGV